MTIRLLARALLFLTFTPTFLIAVDWAPIDPADLARTEPKLDPEADAETMLWENWVLDQRQGSMYQSVYTTYIRMKIYNERAVEEYSTVDVSVGSVKGFRGRLSSVRGRTIKQDGTIIPVENAEVFERTALKSGKTQVQTQSFSLPDVEPGDIIEYQYRLTRDNYWSQFIRLEMQRDTPVWRVHYHVNPLDDAMQQGYRMNAQSYNMDAVPFEDEPLGYYGLSIENVPALKTEPHMPPESRVMRWISIHYSQKLNLTTEKFWKEQVRDELKDYAYTIKLDGAVKAKAAELTSGLESAEEKADAVYAYIVGDLMNASHGRYDVPADKLDRLRKLLSKEYSPKASVIMELGAGTTENLNLTMTALLQAAGLQAYYAHIPGRDDTIFHPDQLNPYLLDRRAVAVELGEDDWRFYDAGSPYMEAGMLDWREEGVAALLMDGKGPRFIMTPFSEPKRNKISKTAVLELSEDGDLSGAVTMTYRGQPGAVNKRVYDGLTEEERETRLSDALQSRIGGALISDVEVKNADSLTDPITISYKIEAPGYAARTGKRLFLEPSFFRKGTSAFFPTAERQHEIYFDYSWYHEDHVTIQLPEGYELEEAEAPAPQTAPEVAEYDVKMTIDSLNRVGYHRTFEFGQNGNIYFPVEAYQPLKQYFDTVLEHDGHVLTVRQKQAGD